MKDLTLGLSVFKAIPLKNPAAAAAAAAPAPRKAATSSQRPLAVEQVSGW